MAAIGMPSPSPKRNPDGRPRCWALSLSPPRGRLSGFRLARPSGRAITHQGVLMSWVEKEVKKRVTASTSGSTLESDSRNAAAVSESTNMAALWNKLESANSALPQEIKLGVETDSPTMVPLGMPQFLMWLRAPNGAGLGFTGEGIRYIWPDTNQRKSNNFWIRWKANQGYFLNQRIISLSSEPIYIEYRFNEQRVDYMVRCLVTGSRIKIESIRTPRRGLGVAVTLIFALVVGLGAYTYRERTREAAKMPADTSSEDARARLPEQSPGLADLTPMTAETPPVAPPYRTVVPAPDPVPSAATARPAAPR